MAVRIEVLKIGLSLIRLERRVSSLFDQELLEIMAAIAESCSVSRDDS